jgi:hypothetical protein
MSNSPSVCIEGGSCTTETPVYAALFVDLKNAFPSTNLPTLWVMLYDAGARGPMMDWMRTLYKRMEYKVRVNGEYSQPFKSLWGILAGDSASPAFFNFYMSDYSPPL